MFSRAPQGSASRKPKNNMDDTPITESERRTLRAIVAMGCEQESAVKSLGWSREHLEEVLENDAELAREMLQAEAQAELHHMRSVHSAAKDEKHWRAATWWLEHKAKKDDSRVSLLRRFASLLEQFIERLIQIVQVEVKQEQDRQRLLDRFRELSREIVPASEPLPPENERVEDNLPEPAVDEPAP
jgi:hypothetical protein